MHVSALSLALAALGTALWPTTLAALPSREEAVLKYIIEFDSTANLQKAGLKRSDESVHERMYADLRSRGLLFSVDQEFTADVFVGASVTVQSDADLNKLASTEGILNVIPIRLVSLPDRRSNDPSSWTRQGASRQAFASSQGFGNVSTAAASSAVVVPPDLVRTTGFSVLGQLGADKVHAAGNRGQGIKIGIIDGGVDYTRPPLGGCFGRPECKIRGGRDFVGDAYTGSNTPQPDDDPISKCDSHGSTVAGIIGANPNEWGVTGVAPDATLYAYRTYGCSGLAQEDVLFAAMERAYQDGVDVLNLSLGEASGWTNSALSVMASRLVAKGMVVVAAAGNSFAAGPFLGSAPATGKGVLGVGSANSTVIPAHNATANLGRGNVTIYNYKNFVAGTFPVVTYTDDPYGCTAAPIDLYEKLIVVRNGGPCSAEDKARRAFNFWGDRILFVEEFEGKEPEYNDFRSLDNAEVSKADGDWLFANSNAGGATLTFSYNPAPRVNTFSGGRGSYFSNQGPTNDLFLNSEILAPGTNIIGVTPWSPADLQTNWSISAGTSWSSAFAAGAAALYLNGKNREALPRTVREALQATADPTQTTNTDGTLLSVSHQGAGALDVFQAINARTTVSPTELLLNDTKFFDSRQEIVITNTGNSERSYRVSNVAAGTQLTMDPATNFTRNFPVPQVGNGAQVQASRSDASFSLRAGRSRTVELRFTAPSGLDASQVPVYSGFIRVESDGETLSVPYLGVAKRMYDNPVFDRTDAYFGAPFKLPLLVDWKTNVAPATENPAFTFQGNDFPALYYRFNGGSQGVYLDLVRADANLGFTPSIRKRDGEGDLGGEWDTDKEAEVEPTAAVDGGAGGDETSEANGDGIEWVDLRRRDYVPPHVAARGAGAGAPHELAKRSWWSWLFPWLGGGGGGNNGGGNNGGGNDGLDGLERLLCKLFKNRLPICQAGSTFAKVPVVGSLLESTIVSRNRNNPFARTDYQLFYFQTPTFRNGSRVPNGSYRMLFRGLRVTGDASRNEDYESYLSPAFTVQA